MPAMKQSKIRSERGSFRALALFLFFGLSLLPGPLAAAADHVFVITIDGMRPDGLAQARTPFLDTLRDCGTSTDHARVVGPSVTLVSHASIFSGVGPDRHKVTWNSHKVQRKIDVPTLMALAQQGDKRTAFIVGKRKLLDLVRDGDVDHACLAGFRARPVLARASQVFLTYRPELMVIHLPDPDGEGHRHGWMSEPYLKAIEDCDHELGRFFKTLVDCDLLERSLFVVTADHGGHDFGHGSRKDEDCIVPWIVAGMGVRAGHVLSRQVRLTDTAATALWALGIEPPASWDGHPVLEAFRQDPSSNRLSKKDF